MKRTKKQKERNDFIKKELNQTPNRFIKSIINRHYNKVKRSSLTYTDMIQEGWVALIKAQENYDESKNVKYSTFAYCWVEGQISNILKRDTQTKIAEYQYGEVTKSESVEKKARLLKELEELSERDLKILNLYAEGYTQKEIKKELSLDMTRRNVGHILDRIQSRFSKKPDSLP